MFLRSEPEAIIMPLVRMQADENHGLIPEPVTRTEYWVRCYEHSVAVLGEMVRTRQYKQTSVALMDIEYSIKVPAICHRRGVEDFKQYCSAVSAYHYEPYGIGAESFGYFSKETIAWVMPHRDTPALLFKTNGKNADYVSHFLGEIEEITMLPGWPSKPKFDTLIVPKEARRVDYKTMQRLTKSMRRNRGLRPR